MFDFPDNVVTFDITSQYVHTCGVYCPRLGWIPEFTELEIISGCQKYSKESWYSLVKMEVDPVQYGSNIVFLWCSWDSNS